MAINLNTIIAKAEIVELEDIATDGHTAYGVYKVAKDVFAQLGLDFSYSSQRFYNFAKNGKINGDKSAKRFTDEEVEDFVARLVAEAQRNA